MKSSMATGNIADTADHFYPGVRPIYSQQFTKIAPSLPLLAEKMGAFNLVAMSDYIAECELRSGKDGVNYFFQVLYIRNSNGAWGY